MKQFGIALSKGNPSMRNAITGLCQDKRWPFWHWIDDFWIVQVSSKYTAASLYDEIEDLSDDLAYATLLVIDLPDSINFYGMATDEAWTWLTDSGGYSG